MIENKKIRFGIVGCGLISDIHAGALASISKAELVGACDINPKRAEEFCEKYGIKPYPSFEALLSDSNIDAVSICTPSLFHKQQAIDALNAGKHVVLEKPMALNSLDAEEICRAAERNGRLLTVIFQTRFAKDVKYLKELIEKNAFGRLCFCDLYMKYYRDTSYYSESSWRGTIKYDGGGALINQGIHGVDLLHHLVGGAKLLGAKAKTIVHDIEAEDCAAALLEYDCGALGVIEASTCSSPGFRRRIEINGERGYAVLSDGILERLFIDGEMLISKDIDPHPSTAKSPALAANDLHKEQIENLISAILNEDTLSVTPFDGYYAVKLIEDIYETSKKI